MKSLKKTTKKTPQKESVRAKIEKRARALTAINDKNDPERNRWR